MESQYFTLDKFGNHIPTPDVKRVLESVGTYDLWKFADSYCSQTEFENVMPLILAYSATKYKID